MMCIAVAPPLKGPLGGALLATLMLCSSALGQAPPKPSQWRAPDGRPRPRHAAPPVGLPLAGSETIASRAAAGRVDPGSPGWRGRICLVVADDIYDSIKADLSVFQQDLEAYGYAPFVYRFVSGDAAALRNYLRERWAEPASLVGAEFIGDLPYIIYEMMQDWGLGDGPEYEDFPCDLYFMDMDGTWSDSLTDDEVAPDNGKYDTWGGARDIEIWVSRLCTSPLASLGTEAGVLSNYLRKDHRFRSGEIHPAWGSLIYPDDDWTEDYADYDQYVAELFYPASESVLIADPEATTASDYLARFTGGFEYTHTRSHGFAGGHGYYEQDHTVFNYVFPEHYLLRQPPALFYSLFVCSAADYTAAGYLAGTLVFDGGDAGLFAWSSTKTGGMWFDGPFFESVAQGRSFGQAFADWFTYVSPFYPSLVPQWWYGMVLIGDATLPALMFTDIPRNQWAAPEIEACARADVVRGFPEGNYRPTDPVSRAAMAVYISRALAGSDAAIPEPSGDPAFPDVPGDYWAFRYVEYASANNIVKGYTDGTYRPDLTVDRGQMAVYVARAMASPPGDEGLADYVPPAMPTFLDVSPTSDWDWCRSYVEYIAAQDIVHGYEGGLYHPEYICTRDQMAVYIARAFSLAVP
jgi:hypothetical protein